MLHSVAIIGATGACGRQLASEILGNEGRAPVTRLQLVGHRSGASEHELHGLCADLRDAYCDRPTSVDPVVDAADIDADIVVMLAGRTLPSDPHADVDRSLLTRANFDMFSDYATVLSRRPGTAPFVIVQSNPVEAGVAAFAAALGPERVVGAGGHSDSQRFRRELAATLGVQRSDVHAMVLGQHGDYVVPAWSQVRVVGLDAEQLTARLSGIRGDRPLRSLPGRVAEVRSRLLPLMADGQVHAAFAQLATEPPDVRVGVKPLLIHYSSRYTTQIATAHAVHDLIDVLVSGRPLDTALQVALEGEYFGLSGVGAVPVALLPEGWRVRDEVLLDDEEISAVGDAFAAIGDALATLEATPRQP